MTIGAELLTVLKTIGALSNRVYAIYAPQGSAFPYVSFTQISGTRGYTHDGADGLKTARYQINVVGVSMLSVKGIRDSVVSTLEGWAITKLSSAYFESEVEFYEDDTNLFRIALDFIIRYY